MSSLYSPFSARNLRKRKGFHGLNSNLLGPAISVVGAPSDMHQDQQGDDDPHESLNFKLDLDTLAALVTDKNNNYLDEVGGIHNLAKLLHTSLENGIRGDVKELCCRRNEFGSNAYWWQNKPRRPVNHDLLGFKNNQWCILIFVQFSFSVWFLTELLLPKVLSLWNVVSACTCLLVCMCFWIFVLRMHKTAQKCEELLNKFDELKCKVVRDGRKLPPIPAHEVVVGDLVLLEKGDRVPADGIVLGEEHTQLMASGNIVLVEDILMLVTSVGENTAFGRDMNFTNYVMQTRQNIEEIIMNGWFTKRARNRNKNQTPESQDRIDIGIINDNDTRFSNLNLQGLRNLVMEKNYNSLNSEFQGVSGVIEALESNRKNGIKGDASDLHQRKSLFSSNTFNLCRVPHPKLVILCNLLKAVFSYPYFDVWFPVEITFYVKFSKYGEKDWWYLALGFYILVAFTGVGQIIMTEINRRCPCYNLTGPMREFDNADVHVVRNGIPKCIPISDVVVGDIVRLRKGNLIPADGLFIDGYSLQLENGSGMIGEIKEELPFMLYGLVVSRGRGRMIVTAVGENNSYEKTHLYLGSHKPLQANIKRLTLYTRGIGFFSVVIIPLLLVVRHMRGKPTTEDGIMEMLLATITVMIKSVISFKRSMLETYLWTLLRPAKFAREVNDVLTNKKPDMFDWITAGKVTTVFADEISMREVVEFRLNAEIIKNVSSKAPPMVLEELRRGIALCSISELVSRTEEGLLSWGEIELGITKTELMQTYVIEDCDSEDRLTWTWMRTKSDGEITRYLHCRGDAEMLLSRCTDYHEIDGTKKPLDENSRTKIEEAIRGMKAKNLLSVALACKHVIARGYDREVEAYEDGRRGPNREANTDEEDGDGTHGKAEGDENGHRGSNGDGLAHENGERGCNGGVQVKEDGGVRATRNIEKVHQMEKHEKNGLTLLGIVALGGGVRQTVRSLQNMGVSVKMVSSGSGISNAIAVARRCGILTPNQKEDEVVVDADAYRQCSDEEAKKKMTNRICVMLRATSTEKHHLVEYLKKNDEVVAVIGRGEEDASVLKEADVGFLMESGSTLGIKQGAEFLIVDGSLTSTYKILKWMRWYQCCLITFIQLQLVMQISVFILNSATTYFSGVTHITDFMLFICDTVLPMLAIATIYGEPLAEEQLKKLPVGRSVGRMVIEVILKGVIVQASLLTVILILIHFRTGEMISGWTKTDMMNMILISSQIFNIITIGLWRMNDRKRFPRRMLLIIVVAPLISIVVFRIQLNGWVACVEICSLFCAATFFMLFYKVCGELETVIHEH